MYYWWIWWVVFSETGLCSCRPLSEKAVLSCRYGKGIMSTCVMCVYLFTRWDGSHGGLHSEAGHSYSQRRKLDCTAGAAVLTRSIWPISLSLFCVYIVFETRIFIFFYSMCGYTFDLMHFISMCLDFDNDFTHYLVFSVSSPENAGLSERQEGCGLLSEPGWSDAVMQVNTNCNTAQVQLQYMWDT